MSGWTTESRLIGATLHRLRSAGAVPHASARLAATSDDAVTALRDAVMTEIPAFSVSGNPDVLPGLDQHVRDHVAEVARLMGGGEPGDFGFVKAHARRRAEQRFPLEVTLHAYRCGLRVLSRWVREAVAALGLASPEAALSAAADFAIDYSNAISIVAAAEYVARTRVLAEAEGDRRNELLNLLLNGYDEADQRVAQLLKRAGYLEQRQAYCVVAVQPVKAAEMASPERAERIITAVGDALAQSGIRMLAGRRDAMVVAVLSDRRRQSGWTAAGSSLVGRIRPLIEMLGPAVVAGLSDDHPSTSYLPKALAEATLALDLASVGNRVVSFNTLPLWSLLVHHGGAALRDTPPEWATSLLAADADADGIYSETLRAIAASNMNMQGAARQLGRHPNTIYARLERLRSLTGKDAQSFADLTELLLAAECWGNQSRPMQDHGQNAQE